MRNAAIHQRPTKGQHFKEDDCTVSVNLSLLVYAWHGLFSLPLFLSDSHSYSVSCQRLVPTCPCSCLILTLILFPARGWCQPAPVPVWFSLWFCFLPEAGANLTLPRKCRLLVKSSRGEGVMVYAASLYLRPGAVAGCIDYLQFGEDDLIPFVTYRKSEKGRTVFRKTHAKFLLWDKT